MICFKVKLGLKKPHDVDWSRNIVGHHEYSNKIVCDWQALQNIVQYKILQFILKDSDISIKIC